MKPVSNSKIMTFTSGHCLQRRLWVRGGISISDCLRELICAAKNVDCQEFIQHDIEFDEIIAQWLEHSIKSYRLHYTSYLILLYKTLDLGIKYREFIHLQSVWFCLLDVHQWHSCKYFKIIASPMLQILFHVGCFNLFWLIYFYLHSMIFFIWFGLTALSDCKSIYRRWLVDKTLTEYGSSVKWYWQETRSSMRKCYFIHHKSLAECIGSESFADLTGDITQSDGLPVLFNLNSGLENYLNNFRVDFFFSAEACQFRV
jgi:hypothetical protein